MWSWDTKNRMCISILNGNLVVLYNDYLTGEPFLSFIGTNAVSETVEELISYSEKVFQSSKIRLIPEVVVSMLKDDAFVVVEDESAHDYILSVEYLSKLNSLPRNGNYSAYWCQKFCRLYPNTKTIVQSILETDTNELINLFEQWSNDKRVHFWELNEYKAFERFVTNKENNNMVILKYDNHKLIGFITYEMVSNEYAIIHFGKAQNQYKGIYCALLHDIGVILYEKNIPYLNFEQDLGIPELRYSKKKFNPCDYLKKYVIERSENGN
jgi:hypothetical protein